MATERGFFACVIQLDFVKLFCNSDTFNKSSETTQQPKHLLVIILSYRSSAQLHRFRPKSSTKGSFGVVVNPKNLMCDNPIVFRLLNRNRGIHTVVAVLVMLRQLP